MKLLVFGGTGQLGKPFVQQALAAGHEITVVTRDKKRVGGVVTALELDVNDPEFILKIPNRVFDSIIYIAYSNQGDADYQRQVTTIAVESLVTWAKANGVKHFILIGSVVVFGEKPKSDPVTELTPKAIDTPYAKNKMDAIHSALTQATSCFKVTILHPAVVYSQESTLLKHYRELLGHHYIPMNADELGTFPAVHAEDAARGILLALHRRGGDGEEYLLCGENISYSKWFQIHGKAGETRTRLPKFIRFIARGPIRKLFVKLNVRVPLYLSPYKADIYRRKIQYSSEKARRELNWSPAHFFEKEF